MRENAYYALKIAGGPVGLVVFLCLEDAQRMANQYGWVEIVEVDWKGIEIVKPS